MNKVELLAPAGNYEALTGALMAGADAVYLGGSAFGARAYADNFTEEEICRGLRMAHLLNKKIYLTVNTLVKEKELSLLYDFLRPFYEEGLDGVIVQDLGVLRFIRRNFPGLPLHVSTQMAVTGPYGASLLKEEGAVRIVPARELSLTEIRELKKQTGLEIETFIHGAMCYCYSGQCLFSSFLGGRSGNRGRCAQPCRLPYRVEEYGSSCLHPAGRSLPEQYPLSMKDMCTLSLLPELVEAGIDSFKIEGRMKKPEYAAGVTAIYRRCLDRYQQDPAHYQVKAEELQYLNSLYIRSDAKEGYYHQYNGRDMITLSSPAYKGSKEALLQEIREQYLLSKPRREVTAKAVLQAGKEAVMTLEMGSCCVTAVGEKVEAALRQPLSEDKIRQQLLKDSHEVLKITKLTLEAAPDIFMPVSSLNRLRRDALLLLASEALRQTRRRFPEGWKGESEAPSASLTGRKAPLHCQRAGLQALVHTGEQLGAVLEMAGETGLTRIYLDRILLEEKDISFEALLQQGREASMCEYYLAFPYLIRDRNRQVLEQLWRLAQAPCFSGILVRNLESLAYLKEKGWQRGVAADFTLYACNQEAAGFLLEQADELCLPVELNRHEWKEFLAGTAAPERFTALIYGRIPMMLSANCVRKTTGKCGQEAGYVMLSDRYGKKFPVYTDCTNCYNIIYNSVPLSLHRAYYEGNELPGGARLDFTTENGEETRQILRYFRQLKEEYREPFYREFTTGHYKRGVE